MISGAVLLAFIIRGCLFLQFALFRGFSSNSNNNDSSQRNSDTGSSAWNSGSGNSMSLASSTHIFMGGSVVISLILLIRSIAFRLLCIRERLRREKRTRTQQQEPLHTPPTLSGTLAAQLPPITCPVHAYYPETPINSVIPFPWRQAKPSNTPYPALNVEVPPTPHPFRREMQALTFRNSICPTTKPGW